MNDVKHIAVAVLATDGFEQAELTEPVEALASMAPMSPLSRRMLEKSRAEAPRKG